jgi:DNA-binding beta-propeller fold protein YncE
VRWHGCLVLTLLSVACSPAGDDRDARTLPDPVVPLAERGSLSPVYQLLPQSEYARLGGSEASFVSAGLRVSAEDKLDELSQQIALDNALVAAPELLGPADRPRAREIPFRGNPSDNLRVPSPDGDLLVVPLGGDLMTPGNEVAVVDTTPGLRVRARITVGLRPQRLALHPAGLVFVCNQYSSYVSIVDPERGALLTRLDGSPVEIPTDFFCSDIAFVPQDPTQPDADTQFLYIANRWRRSVLKYAVDIERDAQGALVDVRQNGPHTPRPLAEIQDVGTTPSRLSVDLEGGALFVANHRGGRVTRIELATDTVSSRFEGNAPSVDVVRSGARVYVPTLMPDRGLLASDEPARSALVEADALIVTGLDGQARQAHPGMLLDGTRSYNFEDVRNGLFELDPSLSSVLYYTDDVSPEPNFTTDQKILAGALPQDLIRNAAGDRLYLAFGGSDLIQELIVRESSGRLLPGRTFSTRERPFALSLDEAGKRLYVVSWGGEVLEAFDLVSGTLLDSVDLGYAEPRYPATDVERGERHFYDASWSNNGRKTCAHCHYDELVSDGVGFSNGVTAPTALHRVKPNHDLLTTDPAFWNGSFDHGSYRSIAFAAQTRTNCELVLFGMVEGPASNPALRIGDPANAFRDERDPHCRPQDAAQGSLPPGFDDEIAAVIAAEKALAAAHVEATTGHDPATLAALIDFYSSAELRLPPNPHAQLRATSRIDPATSARLEAGEQLFARAGCAGCHPPLDPRHPFTNGLDQGGGADWNARFADAYADDPRVLAALPGGLPEVFESSIRTRFPASDINVHLDPIDFFTPFCFTDSNCLSFEDPLAAGIGALEETRRLDLLLRFQLADPDRGFIPGNVRGQVKMNVPSLRGAWTQANFLHHGLARSLREALLAPGHAALAADETGFAVDAAGRFDSHGATRDLTPREVDDLVLYVNSIE